MSLGTVLVVEDDPSIRRGVCDALKFTGYSVREAADGRAGLDAALAGELDLVLLDILMPKMDGMEVLRELRKSKGSLPVIFLTAVGEEQDLVRGLKLGADDYVIKPFGVSELLARIEAVLRRSPGRPAGVPRIVVAGRTIDFERREAVLEDGTRASLTPRESELLAYLAANRGRAVSREELLQQVWGLDPRGMQTRTIDMAVARIRELLRDDPAVPRVIATVRAKGYMLAGEEPGTPDAAATSRWREGSE